MHIVFIIGTAGSGKSLLTSSFGEWLKTEKQNVALINLDPGALDLPYTADLDIREYISLVEIMEKYSLGPNGALVAAADLIADRAAELGREIEGFNPDIVLVDTPGQMELFAFRASGPYIASELTRESKAILYLFDSVFSTNLRLREERNICPEEAFRVLRMQAADIEACTKIGAIIGGGIEHEIQLLTELGAHLGVIILLREDLWASLNLTSELTKKIKSFSLPYPLTLCMSISEKATEHIIGLSKKEAIKPTDIRKVVNFLFKTGTIEHISKLSKELTEKAESTIAEIGEKNSTGSLSLVVDAQSLPLTKYFSLLIPKAKMAGLALP